jgi:hypothetical protein
MVRWTACGAEMMSRFQSSIKDDEMHSAEMMSHWWTWLCQEGPSATKHRGWLHPLVALVVHYATATIVTFGVHDFLLDTTSSRNGECILSDNSSTSGILSRQVVALGVSVYVAWLFVWRLVHSSKDHRPGILYEYSWLCNVTLILGAIGLVTGRPIVATAHCVAVGIDQIMWYVDLTGWTLR